MKEKVGIYLCSCGTNISENVDLDELFKFSSNLDGVGYVKTHKLLCSEEGKNFLIDDIVSEKPTHIIIGACSPKEHEITFRKTCEKAGLNPYLFQMVNLREQVAWVTEDKSVATEKAKKYIKAAINRVVLQEPIEKKEIECSPDTLVLGAGVSGCEAALLLARAGRKVYLVEKNPSIGGKVVRYEEVFPKMECAACMLEPKMDEVLHNENIELLTNSELLEVLGFMGNFVVKVNKKARFVDKDKCFGCNACFEVCPVEVKNEFDYGLSNRKAIYLPYAGALPNVPIIDRNNCLRFKGQDCKLCKDACPFDAINYDDKDEILEKKVGAIVVATGFDIFDPAIIPEYGYGKFPEVYTSLEFERILASNGPTAGKIIMKNGNVPESITIIHCVGSRDKKYKEYCSEVCCLYSLKFTHMIKDKLKDVKIQEIYTDWCLPGKESQEFLNEIKEKNFAEFIRISLPNTVKVEEKKNRLIVEYKDISERKKSFLTDMVVLSPAIIPSKDTSQISQILGVLQDKDGFFAELHTKLAPVSTNIEGIFIVGCAQAPKNIQNSIAQGASASGQILSTLVPGRKLELEAITSEVNEELCGGCKICIGLCPYKAITYNEDKKTAIVNEVLCKGCGTCVAACASGAAKAKHFTTQQIFAEIEGVLR